MNKEQLKEAIGELDLADALFKSMGRRYVDTAVSVMDVHELIDQLEEPEYEQLSLFDGEPKEQHLDILRVLHEIWVEKNKRYGDSFSEVYDELGDMSALTQVLHKVNRLKALTVDEGLDDNDESLDDTLLDLANYCVMWLMER